MPLRKSTYFFFVFFISANAIILEIGRSWTIVQLSVIALGITYILQQIYAGKLVLTFPRYFSGIYLLWVFILLLSIFFQPNQPLFTDPVGTESELKSFGTIGYMYLFWILLNFITVYLVYNIVNTRAVIYKTLKILFYSSLIFSLYGIYQYVSVSLLGDTARMITYILKPEYLFGAEGIRAASFSREPLYFANYLAIVIVLVLVVLISPPLRKSVGIKKESLGLILLINFIAFLLTGSSGAFLSLISACLIIYLVYTYDNKDTAKNRSRNFWTVAAIGVLFVISFYILNQNLIERRMAQIVNLNTDYVRIVSLLEGFNQFLEHPLWGYGLGNSAYFISTTQIHNAFLNIAAETGIISLLVFIGILKHVATRAWKLRNKTLSSRYLSYGLIGCLVVLVVQWMSFYAYVITSAWFIFGFILATDKVMSNSKKSLHIYR